MKWAKSLSVLARAGKSYIATRAAREVAMINRTARFGPDGKVDNILGDRDAIRVGANSHIDGQLLTFAHGGALEIGDWCYIGKGSRIWSAKSVVIGNRVLISHGVEIHDTNAHPLDHEARFRQTQAILTSGHPTQNPGIRSEQIVIGDDVWIGFGACIMKGVTIGARAIIGAKAIVTQDVAADTIVRPSGTESQ